MSRFRRFFSSSFLPVSSSFFSVASPFRLSAAGRPAFLLQENQDYLLDLSKGETKILRARSSQAGRSLLNSQALNWSWKCGDFLIGDIRWGLSLLPSELHAVPAVLPVKILYPSVLGSRN